MDVCVWVCVCMANVNSISINLNEMIHELFPLRFVAFDTHTNTSNESDELLLRISCEFLYLCFLFETKEEEKTHSAKCYRKKDKWQKNHE